MFTSLAFWRGGGGEAILQQHHALGGTLTGHLGMSLEVGLVAILITTKTWSTNDELQETLHTSIDISQLQTTVLHGFNDISVLPTVAGHQQIVTGPDAVPRRAALVRPVGHHNAGKFPFVAKDGDEQVAR